MLFNSYEFLFLFLPITLIVFFVLGARGWFGAALGWLGISSVAFYGYWNPTHVPLVLGSIGVNFLIGHRLTLPQGRTRTLLWIGVVGNLLLLGWYKYAGFIAENLNALFGFGLPVLHQELPLGISFFTFTQIAFLVDAYRGGAHLYSGLRYAVFVLFFPHLIAGPIVHHHQLIPQLERRSILRFQPGPFAAGLTLFILGLAKKVIFADSIATFARPVFDAAAGGMTPGFFTAWGGALSYTLQLYFDFSGYSDMALGLARMFDVKFPVNFNSPYKATSIIDFWRRWHMTLSRFLRDYLYIPLGGSRCGPVRHYVNLFLTMLLGGIWHGAGWTFVIWGAWHGAALCINHGWRTLRGNPPEASASRGSKLLGGIITFIVVMIGWVFFRAANVEAALRILQGMAGLGGVEGLVLSAALRPALWITALLAVAWFLPNTQQLLARSEPALEQIATTRWSWRPSFWWAVAITAIFVTAVLHLSQISEFIYFQF